MRKFKMIPCDEPNDIWVLKEHVWWIFYSVVGIGTKERLASFVVKNGEIIKV